VLTEWDEFKTLDYAKIYKSMAKPAFVFDGRNIIDSAALREIGFEVLVTIMLYHTILPVALSVWNCPSAVRCSVSSAVWCGCSVSCACCRVLSQLQHDDLLCCANKLHPCLLANQCRCTASASLYLRSSLFHRSLENR
jgi:UDP-glucose/GDP-mannose dehydrogenase family, UDP binding domain